jgi:hypothetical protein
MPPFIPDVPYKIQGIFIAVFSYIWISAFTDNYLEEVPLEGEARTEILRANTWRGIISIALFMCSFSYLNPFLDKMFVPNERYQRVVVCLALLYTCFIIFLLHQRPVNGRELFGFLDPNLNKPVTKEMHTYDDDCDLTWATLIP